MRKLTILVLLTFVITTTACSNNNKTTNTDNNSKKPKGTVVESKAFSVLLPDAWKEYILFEEDGTIQLMKEDFVMIQLKMMGDNVNPDENKIIFESQMESYDATFIDNLTIANIDCLGANYEFSGYKYQQYQGSVNGRQFSVMLLDLVASDKDVKDVLESIVIK